MLKKQHKIIFALIFIVFFLLVIFLLIQKNFLISKQNSEKSGVVVESIPSQDIIYISVIVGGKTLHLSSPAGSTLYDTLVWAKQNSQIDFSGKDYPGMGFLVTSIDQLQSGNGKYLFFYINNEEASVGVSSYLLKDGDIIEWKLK